MYEYMHYSFTGIYGSTDSHSVAGTYSVAHLAFACSFRHLPA